jgi:hypothetical protein
MVGSRGHFRTLRLSAAKYAPVLRDDYRIPLQLDSTRLAHATVRLVSNGLLRHSKLFCLPFYSRQLSLQTTRLDRHARARIQKFLYHFSDLDRCLYTSVDAYGESKTT